MIILSEYLCQSETVKPHRLKCALNCVFYSACLHAWCVRSEYVGLCVYGGQAAGHASAGIENSHLCCPTCTHTLMYMLQQSNNDPILTQQPETEREKSSQRKESLQRRGGGGVEGWAMLAATVVCE